MHWRSIYLKYIIYHNVTDVSTDRNNEEVELKRKRRKRKRTDGAIRKQTFAKLIIIMVTIRVSL